MTVEATVTKLAYCMGRGLSGEQLKTAMESDLRGELTLSQASSYGGYGLKQLDPHGPEFLSKL